MISLEQVRQLDVRVKKAVIGLKALTAENNALKQHIAELEANLAELRDEASARQADEQRLEVGLQGVLDVLDEVDRETADVEPEPEAESIPIETSPERTEEVGNKAPEQEAEAALENEGTPNAPEVAAPSEKDEADFELEPETASPEEPAAETQTDNEAAAAETAEEAPAEETPKNDAGAEERELTKNDGSSEDVVLDDEPVEAGDYDQYQSEFDIF